MSSPYAASSHPSRQQGMDRARKFWQEMLMGKGTLRYAILYGGPLAGLAVILQWAEYRYFVMKMPGEVYIAVLATLFVGMGIWIGMRLTARSAPSQFEANEKAAKALGLTKREREVLEHLAKGASNKEIARTFGVSPNTIKRQVASLYSKLDVNGRGKAVEAARSLSLIP